MWQTDEDRGREINPTAKIEEIQEGAKEMKMRMEIKEGNVIKAAKMNDKEEDHEHREEEISQKLTPGKEEELKVEGSRDNRINREDNRDREESSRVHKEQGNKIHKEGSKINKEEPSRINQEEGNKTNQKGIDSCDREENRREHKEGQQEEEMQEADNRI